MINKKRSAVRMHNLILNYEFVDHVNGNGLDNRIENLRQSNHKFNAQNRQQLIKNKTSQYKGVIFWKQSKLKRPWLAKIKVNGQNKDLGFFKTEIEAAKAYNKAALKYFQHPFINRFLE